MGGVARNWARTIGQARVDWTGCYPWLFEAEGAVVKAGYPLTQGSAVHTSPSLGGRRKSVIPMTPGDPTRIVLWLRRMFWAGVHTPFALLFIRSALWHGP